MAIKIRHITGKPAKYKVAQTIKSTQILTRYLTPFAPIKPFLAHLVINI